MRDQCSCGARRDAWRLDEQFDDIVLDEVATTTVPEPGATLSLLIIVFAGIAGRRRRMR